MGIFGSTVITDTTPQRDFQQYYDMYFEDLTGSVLIEDLEDTVNPMHTKMILTLSSSVFCFVSNFALLIFLFMDKEQRSLIYFPLMLQAFVDIIGPGIANAIYEVRLYPSFSYSVGFWNDENVASELFQWLLRDSINQVPGKVGCFSNLLRQLLNEYTTGVCVALSAFYRYILVCHPTKNFLKKKVLWRITISISACILIASATVVCDMFFDCPLRSCEQNPSELACQQCSTFEFLLAFASSFSVRHAQQSLNENKIPYSL